MKDTITAITAREVLDSRGKPTVECEMHCGAIIAGAIVPSGASTGAAEAFELRDGDPARYDGQGVLRAVNYVRRVIAPAVIGLAADDQEAIDRCLRELDASPRKTTLGANAILSVSLAAAHVAAAAKRMPLYRHFHELFGRRLAADGRAESHRAPRMPLPMVNMISGGKHAGGNLDFQDILIQPIGTPRYADRLEWVVRVYRRLGKLLLERGFEGYLVGDEGGFGPRLGDNRAAVEITLDAVRAAGLRPGDGVNLAIDVASSHFYREGAYHLAAERGRSLTSDDMIERLAQWCDAFPIASLEDGLAEDDWSGWERLTARLGERVRLVGDDFFATSPERIAKGIACRAANAVLIKVNQIGTLSETLEAMSLARSAGMACVVSARSGETEDSTIADLAVGTAAESIKIGSIVRSERLAKYNRLLRIAEELEPA